MTPRQRRNLAIARQRRAEKARAAYEAHVAAHEDMVRQILSSGPGCIARVSRDYRPELYGQPPKGVTVARIAEAGYRPEPQGRVTLQ